MIVTLLVEVEVETFKDWPIYMTHKPNDSTKAKYFYTGHVDIILVLHRKMYCLPLENCEVQKVRTVKQA